MWRFRELLRRLVLRNLQVKYQRSALGFLWTLLQPLSAVVVLTLVFSRVVRLPIEDYWAFLISGYFVWSFFQQCLNAGTFVVAEHRNLIRSVAFPKELLVLGAVLSRFIEFSIELLLILAVVVLFHHHAVPGSFALLPVLILLQLFLVVGLTLLVATLAVFFKDVQHALPIVLMTLFYVSPVFYPASMIPDEFRTAYLMNPAAQLLSLFQMVLYEGRIPPGGLLGLTAISATAILFVGSAVFARYRGYFAEIL